MKHIIKRVINAIKQWIDKIEKASYENQIKETKLWLENHPPNY